MYYNKKVKLNSKKFLIACIASVLLVLSSCKKEETVTPTPQCNDFSMALSNLGANPMDSVRIVVKEYYNNTQYTFDSTFVNPPSGFNFTKEFCGDYLFDIEFFHQQTTQGWEVKIKAWGNNLDAINVNGSLKITSDHPLSR